MRWRHSLTAFVSLLNRYKKVRIFKVMGVSEKSKAWVADPANRLCDVPGSWFCPGQYPPALHKLIAKRKDFAQVGVAICARAHVVATVLTAQLVPAASSLRTSTPTPRHPKKLAHTKKSITHA